MFLRFFQVQEFKLSGKTSLGVPTDLAGFRLDNMGLALNVDISKEIRTLIMLRANIFESKDCDAVDRWRLQLHTEEWESPG